MRVWKIYKFFRRIHTRRMTTMTLCMEENKGYKLTYTAVERRDPFYMAQNVCMWFIFYLFFIPPPFTRRKSASGSSLFRNSSFVTTGRHGYRLNASFWAVCILSTTCRYLIRIHI